MNWFVLGLVISIPLMCVIGYFSYQWSNRVGHLWSAVVVLGALGIVYLFATTDTLDKILTAILGR